MTATAAAPLRILYRGPLSSCNYGCVYCPFAKTKNTREELADDDAKLERFTDWVAARESPVGVFFTPWGEALIRKHYQRAIARLSHLPQLERVAIQTNLSCDLGWLDDCAAERVGVWATYHPAWTDRRAFVEKITDLSARGVSVSAGVVGFLDVADEIEELRAELPSDVYLWINANKRDKGYYSEQDIVRFEAIDPNFRTNTIRHPSEGFACRAGLDVISVDGDGDVRRCHFIKEPIGNLYAMAPSEFLVPRPCTNETCGCHIGYVHLERLGLREVYGNRILERVPQSSSWSKPTTPRSQVLSISRLRSASPSRSSTSSS